jgi:hypothetical protein
LALAVVAVAQLVADRLADALAGPLGDRAQARGEALDVAAAAFVVGQALAAADRVGVLDQAALEVVLLVGARRAEQGAAPAAA